MAPNKRRAGRVLVGCWTSAELRDRLKERATAEGLTMSDALAHAAEEWLAKPPSPPPAA